ncbi:alpha-keto ester reductase-like protein [Thermochaetoides thermophila DSM 1495]|uniref:Alpha-keto ester reductase-like protein n=1 Tax=Chaetomium thermophilum (strain DSM 1495 / CBS 144.50 / IMI 039719) TaxID=759272 RepID=G0RYA8_CHATD|nr:alpha-keto ester reductase-like protein [Thermochaetoides thermophila DSM 1495]EGS23894.1 alpha-keto ester reductase-like protein [Thermochaetoides thermophila DSM 1495]
MSADQYEPIPTVKLSDGNEIPLLGYGLGTANFKRGNKDEINEKIIGDTLTALKVGYYHLDGAEAYGNERELGLAISRSGLPRHQLFVTTKTSCRQGESIETAFSRSLAALGLDYVDLYLIHSPFFSGPDPKPEELQAKWREMEAIKDSGRAKSIGVSNFLRPHLEAVLSIARHKPVVNQIEYHPYLQHDVDDLIQLHREQGIVIEAYGPLTAVTKAKPGPVDEVYERLAKKYGVEEGDVALRWCLDQGVVALTTSGKEERLRGFRERLPKFKLTEEEIQEISEKGRGKHYRGFWGHIFKEDDRR